MKLTIDGRAATEAVMCMRDGMWLREGVLARLKLSSCEKRLGELVRAADDALHETERAMSQWWQAGDTAMQSTLASQHGDFLRLAGAGWGTLEFMVEASRYLPKVLTGADRPSGMRYYNPLTGEHDLPRDAGWTGGGLPPRR